MNPIGVSSRINRLIESGIISEARFDPERNFSSKLHEEDERNRVIDDTWHLSKTGDNKTKMKLAENIRKMERDFIGFETKIDWFDMRNFVKILPLLAVCTIVNFAVFRCEFLHRSRSHSILIQR